jgi:hypothetical protein
MPPVFYDRRRRWPLVLLGLVALIVVALVVVRRPADQALEPENNDAPPPAAEVPLQHVHGLGVDPLQGALYAATHSGLIRFSGHGEPEHIGDHRDLMGFTVVGPDHFLASGHPDVAGVRDGLPGHLGVMESTDGGSSWEIVALRGEADLHAIAYTDGQAYAIDATSGRFLASSDLRTWETRSPSSAASIAVDPDNDQRIVTADGSRLQISDDGGRAWRTLQGPELLYVAWGPGSDLWGVGADGRTYSRRPADGSWQELDRLAGEPQAVLSDGVTRYAAAHDGEATTIHVLRNGRWQEEYAAR